MTLKIKTKKEQELSLRFFKAGVLGILIYVLPLCFSMDWISDTFVANSVEKSVAILLCALFWWITLCATTRHVLKWLWEVFEVEFVEGRE